MRGIEKIAAKLLRGAIIATALSCAACATFEPQQPEPEPVVHEPVEIIPAPEPTPAPVEIIPVVPDSTALPSVAIVLTNTQPAYADVAAELANYFDDFKIYDLSDNSRPPVSVLRAINDSNNGAVVAIGLRAAKSSVAMSERPVVFSQVFNYQDHGLITDNSRGIAANAPLGAQIKAWKEAEPGLTRIGAIVGEGHDDLIFEAQRAAESHGIELRVQVTRSDQETLYFFKRMVRDIDGFWLFPDNRVLSRRALQEIMDDAQRNQVAVLVPTESMLQAGATISVSSVASDIAATIAKVIRQIESGDISKVPPISPLNEVRVKTKKMIQVVDR
jgi:ABC-type uncharacterized transport system substrate-binding protein